MVLGSAAMTTSDLTCVMQAEEQKQQTEASIFLSQASIPSMSPEAPRPPNPPDFTSKTSKNKLRRLKYSCEEVYERMDNGLCIFCDELDTPDHHNLKHKGVRIFMVECGDDRVSDDKELVSSVLDQGGDRTKIIADEKLSPPLRQSIEHLEGKHTEHLEFKSHVNFSSQEEFQKDSATITHSSNDDELSFSQKDDRVWEPGGLPAKLYLWDWPDKESKSHEKLHQNEMFLYPHMQVVKWGPEEFKNFDRERSNKTLYLEDEHEQRQVMKLISSWNNRIWEPGRVFVEWDKCIWSEKYHKHVRMLSLLQKFQKVGLLCVMKWDLQELCYSYEKGNIGLKQLFSWGIDCEKLLDWFGLHFCDKESQKKIGTKVVSLSKYTTGESKLAFFHVKKSRLSTLPWKLVEIKGGDKGLPSDAVKKKQCKDENDEVVYETAQILHELYSLGGSLLVMLKRHEASVDMVMVPYNSPRVVKFIMDQSEKPLVTVLSYAIFHSPRPPELSCCKEDKESSVIRTEILRTSNPVKRNGKSFVMMLFTIAESLIWLSDPHIRVSTNGTEVSINCRYEPHSGLDFTANVTFGTFMEEFSSVCESLLGAFVLNLIAEHSQDSSFFGLLSQWKDHPPDRFGVLFVKRVEAFPERISGKRPRDPGRFSKQNWSIVFLGLKELCGAQILLIVKDDIQKGTVNDAVNKKLRETGFQRMEKLSRLCVPGDDILMIWSFDGDIMKFRAVAFHIKSLVYLYESTLGKKIHRNSYNKYVTKVFVHWKEHPPDEDLKKIHGCVSSFSSLRTRMF